MKITTTHVKKHFGSLEVLKGIELDLNQGEMVSIVGASGAGKSTLLQILGTLERPSSGQLLFDNVDVTRLSDAKLSEFRNKNIGFVFQFHHLLPEFTALENVCMPAFIQGKKKNDVAAKALDYLKYLGIADRANHKPSKLSGGEQQRVAMARALINNPAIILADEPTGNLDSKSSEDLYQLIGELRNEFNQTFVIVTHDPKMAQKADRILTIEDGVLI